MRSRKRITTTPDAVGRCSKNNFNETLQLGCGGIKEIRRQFRRSRVTVLRPGSGARLVLGSRAISCVGGSPFGLATPRTAPPLNGSPLPDYFRYIGAASYSIPRILGKDMPISQNKTTHHGACGVDGSGYAPFNLARRFHEAHTSIAALDQLLLTKWCSVPPLELGSMRWTENGLARWASERHRAC